MNKRENYRRKKMNEILNPSCSEVVWRLNIDKSTKEKIIDEFEGNEGGTCGTQTDSFPNGCLGDIIILLEEAKEDGKDINNVEIEYVDNSGGGGGNWDFVENCFEIAKVYLEGRISRERADKLEEDYWNKGDEMDMELELNSFKEDGNKNL